MVVDGWSNEELEGYIKEHNICCPDCGKSDFLFIRRTVHGFYHVIVRAHKLYSGTSHRQIGKYTQKNFPDKVECVAKGGMSLNEYLPLLNRTNILIDQAYADSVGMNGLYALAMGKVVLGGNAPENQKEFNEYDCPIVNIEPDVEDIYCKLEDLILNSDKIGVLSKKSREYVERVHDAKVIAKKYISVFEGELLIINTHNNLLV